MRLQSHQRTFILATACAVFLAGADRVAAEDWPTVILHGRVSRDTGTHQPASSGSLEIELAHEHTLGMRDIGNLSAELERTKQAYERQRQLVLEGIGAQRELETAEMLYKKAQIDLLARWTTLAQDEAAILHKHHVPVSAPPVLDESQINSILQQGHETHTYSQTRE